MFTDKPTALLPMTEVNGALHEDAGHEGHCGMENIPRGTRMKYK